MSTNRLVYSTLMAIGWAAGLTLSAALAADEPTTQPAPAPQPPPPQHLNNTVIIAPGGGGMTPMKIQEVDRGNLNMQKQVYNNFVDAGTFQIDELLQCTVENGRMKANVTNKELPVEGFQFRAKVQGLTDPLAATAQWKLVRPPQSRMAGGMTTIQGVNTPGASGASGNRNITICRNDFDQDKAGQIWQIEFFSTPETIQITGTGIGIRVTFRQTAQAADLNVMMDWKPNPISAASLADLLQQHPVELRKYLSPLLLRLTGRDVLAAGPADVYGAFTEIPADPNVTKSVGEVLVRMDSDDFAKRETASAELAKLGTPGVLAVLRLDRSKLSQEQKTRCDKFVATGKTLDLDDPADGLHNVYLLLDAMNYSDVRVREAAKKAWGKLQGHAVDIDVSPQADAAVRLAALEKLRADSAADKETPKPPATQPQ